jgi:hypothetical protein
MRNRFLDKMEVLEGVKITYLNSPDTIKTTRFWEFIQSKVEPNNQEMIIYVAQLESQYRGTVQTINVI